jgi:hypothetical protein
LTLGAWSTPTHRRLVDTPAQAPCRNPRTGALSTPPHRRPVDTPAQAPCRHPRTGALSTPPHRHFLASCDSLVASCAAGIARRLVDELALAHRQRLCLKGRWATCHDEGASQPKSQASAGPGAVARACAGCAAKLRVPVAAGPDRALGGDITCVYGGLLYSRGSSI